MAAETTSTPTRHRPKSLTVFAAAFVAGAAAAVGVNRVLDVHLAQKRPQVECEPIFVALRGLPQGAPVTVWDVALKDWPKAMLPSTALRSGDSFEGCVLRHPVREGQPLLSVQLVRSGVTASGTMAQETFTAPVPAAAAAASTSTQTDPWMPAESISPTPVATAPVARTTAAPTQAQATAERPMREVARVASEPAQPTAVAARASQSVPETSTSGTVSPEAAVAPSPAPTPAAEPTTVAEAVPTAPSSTDIEPPTPVEPTVADQEASEDDGISEAVATDVQTMPSVMKTNGQSVAQAARPSTADAGRYLVVPERIALQADTSFTTPRPQPPGPPTATPKPSKPATQPSASATPRRGAPARPQASGRTQQPQQQPAPAKQPAPNQKASAPRTWGGMFPNVAAGIEAIGAPWQRTRSAASQPTPPSPPARR